MEWMDCGLLARRPVAFVETLKVNFRSAAPLARRYLLIVSLDPLASRSLVRSAVGILRTDLRGRGRPGERGLPRVINGLVVLRVFESKRNLN